MKLNWLKIIIALSAAVYFFRCAADPGQWHFIDGVNLLVHEAGHVVFIFFGQFPHMLGGSLLQVLVPLLFVACFFISRRYFSAAIVLFWAGESLLNVSVYAADAISMQLPLLGGDGTIHDWNWLLIYLGQLRHTAGIALALRLLGTATIAAAAAWSLWAACLKDRANVPVIR